MTLMLELPHRDFKTAITNMLYEVKLNTLKLMEKEKREIENTNNLDI